MDTKIPGYGADILAAVRKITDLPVTTIINTHTHWDQAGANPEFSETVNIVTHENTAAPTATATYSSSSKEARAILVGDMMARKLLPHIDVDYAGFYNDLLMQTQRGTGGRPQRRRDRPQLRVARALLRLRGAQLPARAPRPAHARRPLASAGGSGRSPEFKLTPFAGMGDHARTHDRVCPATMGFRSKGA